MALRLEDTAGEQGMGLRCIADFMTLLSFINSRAYISELGSACRRGVCRWGTCRDTCSSVHYQPVMRLHRQDKGIARPRRLNGAGWLFEERSDVPLVAVVLSVTALSDILCVQACTHPV